MLNTVVTGAALLAALAATAAVPSSSSAAPPPRRVAVKIVSVNGSGCLTGKPGVTAGTRSFTVTYPRFTASAGPGSGVLDFRKNCQLTLDVAGPKGWTWGISRIVTRGTADLRQGASATQSASYYWAGTSRTGRLTATFTGPAEGTWTRTRKIPAKQVDYLSCGARRYLNVNFELRVNAGSSTGRNTLTMASTRGSDFHLLWRRC